MTATAPTGPQGTGNPITDTVSMVLESFARHRTNRPVSGVPPWFLIAMTGVAVAAGITGMLIHSLAVLLLALAYAVIALAADVVAAVQGNRTEGGE